jgi:hypothetical protein
VLALAGLLLTFLGILLRTQVPFLFNFFTCLGGTAFGSALGISFARIFEPSQIGNLLNVLAEANRSSILSAGEDRCAYFRKLMHGYLRSRDDRGRPVWRYRIFDFSVSRTPGHLHTVIDVFRPDGKERKFIYDGYLCGDHLVLIGQPAILGSEQHVVHVFPDALKVQTRSVSGFCFVDSFDNSRLVTPTILSDIKLTSQTVPGQVPAGEEHKLNDEWKSQLGQSRQLNFDPASFTAVTP